MTTSETKHTKDANAGKLCSATLWTYHRKDVKLQDALKEFHQHFKSVATPALDEFMSVEEGREEDFSAQSVTIPALVTGYRFAGFALVQAEGKLDYGPQKYGIPSDGEIFELRAFCSQAELRWLADPIQGNRCGQAVWLMEEKMDALEGWCSNSTSHPCYARQGNYLLWGDCRQNGSQPDGWSRLFDHRIGDLWVPISDLRTKEQKDVEEIKAADETKIAEGSSSSKKQKHHRDDKAVLCVTEYFHVDDDYGNLAFFTERLTGVSRHAE